jgi:hypothetical protein
MNRLAMLKGSISNLNNCLINNRVLVLHDITEQNLIHNGVKFNSEVVFLNGCNGNFLYWWLNTKHFPTLFNKGLLYMKDNNLNDSFMYNKLLLNRLYRSNIKNINICENDKYLSLLHDTMSKRFNTIDDINYSTILKQFEIEKLKVCYA